MDRRVLAQARTDLGIEPGDPRRRVGEAVAIDVFTDGVEDVSDRSFDRSHRIGGQFRYGGGAFFFPGHLLFPAPPPGGGRGQTKKPPIPNGPAPPSAPPRPP